MRLPWRKAATSDEFREAAGRVGDDFTGYMLRVWESGEDVTDLIRSFRTEAGRGGVFEVNYVIDVGSGLVRHEYLEARADEPVTR